MKLLLVDGTNAIMRRVTAVGPDEITPEQAAFDTVARITKAALDLGMTHLIVALDARDSWRYEVFPDYKKGRTTDTTPWGLALGEALEARKVKVVAYPKQEADDVIATITHRVAGLYDKPESGVWTLSSDNDLLQLVGPPNVHVMQYAPKGMRPWLMERTTADVLQTYGVPPDRYPEYLALVGGKNGVPGVPRIGAKTAAKLLKESTAEQLMADGRIKAEHHGWLRTAIKLHSLDRHAPIERLLPKQCAVPMIFGSAE